MARLRRHLYILISGNSGASHTRAHVLASRRYTGGIWHFSNTLFLSSHRRYRSRDRADARYILEGRRVCRYTFRVPTCVSGMPHFCIHWSRRAEFWTVSGSLLPYSRGHPGPLAWGLLVFLLGSQKVIHWWIRDLPERILYYWVISYGLQMLLYLYHLFYEEEKWSVWYEVTLLSLSVHFQKNPLRRDWREIWERGIRGAFREFFYDGTR